MTETSMSPDIDKKTELRRFISGFTLLEILVVLVIIGISFSFVLLSVNDFGQKRRIKTAALEFKQFILLLEHQAILESDTLGIRLDQNSYQILRFSPPNHWLNLKGNNHLFQIQQLPKGTVIDLQKNKNHSQRSLIIINSTGELSPFVMIWGSEKQRDLYRLTGHQNGSVDFETIHS